MTAYDVIFELYPKGTRQADILIDHSERVRDKALAICEQAAHLRPDKSFVAEGALLHDIGIYQTDAPQIHCHGPHPYILHGLIGRQILEERGMEALALVCERHIGAGITAADIEAQKLPLPKRDMLPTTIEEIIISYADGFYSKTNGAAESPLDKVIAEIGRFGNDKVERFMKWHRMLTATP